MRDASDEELVLMFNNSEISRADRDTAVNELFKRYHSRVAAWCFRMVGDRDWAADLAQDTFVRALRALPAFRLDSKFSTWIYTIARNQTFNAREARALRRHDEVDAEMPDLAERIDETLESVGEIAQMKALLNTLDETERTVMTLHFGEEMTLSAVTRLLRLDNPSGAKAYIVSAKRKLKTAVARAKGTL